MSVSAIRDSSTPGADAATRNERRATTRRIILDAVVLGGLADALLHDGLGVGLSLWMLAFAATVIHFARQRADGLTREQRGWLLAALFFGAVFAWRDSSGLLFVDFLAMLLALAILGATVSEASPIRSILGQRVRDLVQVLVHAAWQVFAGVVLAARASGLGELPESWRGGRVKAIVRATFLTLPLLLIFGALLESADPLFGAIFSLPKIDLGEVMSHVILAGFFAWVVGGWLYGAIIDDHKARRVPDGMPLALGSLDVTIVLGGLLALFAAFVGVQIGWLFGGERLVRSTTGLGYAQYARHGFFELVWVSLLILPVLLGTRAALRDEDSGAIRRHRLLAIPLLVLIGGVMASALGRMALYVHYYGLSTDRLFATVFMIWLAIVFIWFGLTVLRGRLRDFAAGMTITGFLSLAALNLANPEALVAKVNIARAPTALTLADSARQGDQNRGTSPTRVDAPIDYRYLASMDGDAVEHVVAALVANPVTQVGGTARSAEVMARCDAARTLLRRWQPGPEQEALRRRRSDWRLWNVGAWRASRAVQTHDAALRAVTCWDGNGEATFGDRDRRPARPGEQGYSEPRSQ